MSAKEKICKARVDDRASGYSAASCWCKVKILCFFPNTKKNPNVYKH